MPTLDAAQLAHAARVHAALSARIAARGGWLPFDEYLDLVLYAPGLGYYSAGAAKLGATGDFITAPELSPLFGACIARHCAPLLRGAAGRGGGDLLELGAGTGALAEVLLLRLADLEAVPGHYFILEVSADLRARQRARLGQLPPALQARVQWLEQLPEPAIDGVILANEVVDALPFQCFVARPDAYDECGVALDPQGRPLWSARPASAVLQGELRRLAAGLPQPMAAGYSSELCTRAGPWLAGLSAALHTGCILLFDYGLSRRELYHPQRASGTLRCHYRHRAHEDPFLYPGLQDITAWVDFTRLAEAAADAGLEVAGYCTQAAFLLGAGIEAELGAISDVQRHARLAAQARALLLPDEMGETFKAMLLTRGLAPAPAAFAVQDLRRLL
jgi:SAM-dependent MidA family methyltransferase